MAYKPLKIRKRGRRYFLDYYRPDGERRRISVGSDKGVAQQVALQYNNWLIEGKDPDYEINKNDQELESLSETLEAFFPSFMERHGNFQSKSTKQFYHERFNNIRRCPALAKCRLSAVNRKLVLDYMHARRKLDNVSNGTVNRELAVIMAMLNKAVEWDIIPSNPIVNLKRFPESPKRNVSLTPDEAAQLIDELPEAFGSVVEFAIYTGFRKENILSLNIEQIVFHDLTETGEVRLRLKTGKYEVFPLSSLAVAVLKREIGKRKTGYVFINPVKGTRYQSVSRSFRRAVQKLDLTVNDTPLRFHDLRHVFATWLHMHGASLDQLRLLMGHSNRSTTDRYTTATAAGVRNVLTLMPRINILKRNQA